MGAGEPSAESHAAAFRLGRLIAERGWILLTGGRPAGIMAAAAAGAKQIPGSLTLGILPTASGGEGADIDVAVFTGMGEARNAINVLSSDVVVACGVEGPGTASEVALSLKAGRPTVLLGPTAAAATFFRTLAGKAVVHEATTPEAVIALIEQQLGIRRWRAV